MTNAELSGAGRRALLQEQLGQAHVGVAAGGPDGLFGPIPSSWPMDGVVRLPDRWLLDFLDRPSQRSIVRAWRTLPEEKVATLEVGLNGGQRATAWMI
ncbi:MAG TPA: hypothetical protein VMM13_19080, partial [Euzebya sp.]|nr:hypothetical protein [Euzebya sp.]